MALGQLVVSLGLDAAEFISGMSKSELQAKRFAQTVDRAIAAGVIKAEIAIRSLGAAARTAADTFQALTTGAAQFKDLEETTGAAAESIASLAVSAATAGVDINDVAGATQKLTKNLVGVDDESKAAGAALKALNINVADFKKLDPVGQYEAIGKALSGYADGAEKVAVAQALFGKSGAEQLKVFKALEEAGGRQTILTQRQIELADAYADRQAKSAAQLRLYAQAVASEALPALTDLTKAFTDVLQGMLGVDATGKQLAGNAAVREFAEDAADAAAFLADALVATGRVANVVGGVIQAIAADVKLLGTIGKAASPLNGGILANTDEIKAAFEERNRTVAEQGLKLDALLQKDAAAFRNALSAAREARKAEEAARRLEDRGFTPTTKPRLNFEGADSDAQKAAKERAAAAKKAAEEAARYIESLDKQLQATFELTAAEKVMQEIRSGSLAKAGVVAQQVALGYAEEIDANKELIRLARERADFKNRDYQAGNDAAAANALADQVRLTGLLANTEKAIFDSRQSNLIVLQNALEKGDIAADQYADAVRNLFGIIKEEGGQATDVAKELGLTFSSAFEDAIVEGQKLSDLLKALEKDILRIVTRKLVTEPLAGGITGLLNGGLASLGNFFSAGNGFTYGADLPNVGPPVPLATGMDYVPYDGFPAILHRGERVMTASENARGGRRSQNNYITINMPAGTTARTAQQAGAELVRRLASSDVRNN